MFTLPSDINPKLAMCTILKVHLFCSPLSRLLVREASPYLSCSLSITMRNVESRPAAAFVLAYCPCVITKEKDHDEAGSPRKKDRESNEAKRTGIQKEEEEARRRRREKRKIPNEERSKTRSGGSWRREKKRIRRKGEKRILRTSCGEGTWCSKCEWTGKRAREERREERRSEAMEMRGAVQKEKSRRWRWSRRWNGSFVNRD